jgi:hypothetical protein
LITVSIYSLVQKQNKNEGVNRWAGYLTPSVLCVLQPVYPYMRYHILFSVSDLMAITVTSITIHLSCPALLQLPTNWSVLLSYVWISSLTASGIHPLPVSSLSFEVETGLADDEVDVAGEGAAGCLSRIIGIIPGVQWPFWTIVGFIKWYRWLSRNLSIRMIAKQISSSVVVRRETKSGKILLTNLKIWAFSLYREASEKHIPLSM